MHTSGGRVSTTIGGVNYSARGNIKIMGSNMEVAAGANQDGSAYRTVAARVRTVEMTFDRFVDQDGTPLRWSDNIMGLTNLGIIFVEQDGSQTHIMTGGFFVGTPGLDTATGEVDGLSLAADTYKTIQN